MFAIGEPSRFRPDSSGDQSKFSCTLKLILFEQVRLGQVKASYVRFVYFIENYILTHFYVPRASHVKYPPPTTTTTTPDVIIILKNS